MRVHPININFTTRLVKQNNIFAKNSAVTNQNSDVLMQYLSLNANYNISFTGHPQPIYAIDEVGNYQKFSGRKQAVEAIKTDGSSISQCLSGKRMSSAGYFFAYASEIERQDDNGNWVVDNDLLNKKIEEIKSKYKPDACKKAVYSVDSEGNFVRYSSVNEAAKAVGGSDSNISKCMNGKQHLCGGFGFISADEVEHIGKRGKILVDKKKIEKKAKEVQRAIEEQAEIRPFYAVDKNGNYQKFIRNRDAVHALNLHSALIKHCLDGKRDTTGDYAFFYADEVETIDEKGNTVVKFDVSDDIFCRRTPVPIYSIDKNGKVKRFPSKGAAETALGVDSRNIQACLTGERLSANGYAFLLAENVETIDKNGNTVIDTSKFNQEFQQIIRNAVYIVDKNGKFKRYDNCVDAAEALGVSRSAVLLCVSGISKSVKGRTAVKASYVEKFEKDRVYYNLTLLRKCGEEAASFVDRPIVAFDSEGHSKRFKNKATASRILGIRNDKIGRCLTGEQKTSGGYRFEYVDTQYPKRRKSVKIYTLDRGGEVKEYKNIDEAAKILGIDRKEIEYFMKKGRTSDKKTTLNGYVFATDNDI